MEFRIEKEEILRGLARTQSIVEKKNTIQILSNVLLRLADSDLTIEATDLEVGMRATYVAEPIAPGGVTVDAKTLYEVVRQTPEGVKIHFKKKDNNWLEITAGRSVFNLVGLAPEDFPEVPVPAGESQWTMKSDILKGMIDKTIFAVSQEDMRYNLSGVFMEMIEEGKAKKVRMVATDGHRLSLIDSEFEGDVPITTGQGVIVPKKGLAELRRLLDEGGDPVGLLLEGNNLIAKRDKLVLVMRLVDGRFPDYRQVIPYNNDKAITLAREEFVRALRRVSILSYERVKMVKFRITQAAVEITSESPDMGTAREEVPVQYDGPDMTVGFNSTYLLDILGAVDDQEVVFKLFDESSPGEVRPTKERGYFFIIMPMKI
jgi:DNA polymerase-3 subunit beta